MSPNSNRSQQACLLLFIVSQCVPSIISRESMHKHKFGQTLALQSVVVTVNIRSRSLKSYSLFSVSKQITYMYLRKVGADKTFGSEDRAQKRLNLHFFTDDNLEMG